MWRAPMLTTLALLAALTQPVGTQNDKPPRTVSALAQACEDPTGSAGGPIPGDASGIANARRRIAEQLRREAEAAVPQTADRFLDLARCQYSGAEYRAAEAALARARELLQRDIASAPPAKASGPRPTLIGQVAPVYPDSFKVASMTGVVMVRVAIDPDGHVSSAEIVGSVPVFDEQALVAARRMQFKRIVVNGKPATASLTVPIRFDRNPNEQPTESIDISRMFAILNEAPAALVALDRAVASVRHDARVSEDFTRRFPTAVRPGDSDVRMPGVRRAASPHFSLEILQRKIQGTVTVLALIDVDGSVKATTVLRSVDPDVDDEAQRSARQWLFTPATKNGVPVPIISSLLIDLTVR